MILMTIAFGSKWNLIKLKESKKSMSFNKNFSFPFKSLAALFKSLYFLCVCACIGIKGVN